MERVTLDISSQGARVKTLEEKQAVNAMRWTQLEQRRSERLRAARRKARRQQLARQRLAALLLLTLVVILLWIVVAKAGESEAVTKIPTSVGLNSGGSVELDHGNNYLSNLVPLPYDLQEIMWTACQTYECPYPLALAVAEVESNFDLNAIGDVGEVGIMQLNPGPGGSYHAELTEATGQDPTTPAGNIICGVYLLGKYMTDYETTSRAVMAYNMGVSGAKKAWAAGIFATEYTSNILDAMEGWKCALSL